VNHRLAVARPIVAFGLVVLLCFLFYLLLWRMLYTLSPETVNLKVPWPTVLFILPIPIAAATQFFLTQKLQMRTWLRVLQVSTASLLGPYIAASALFLGYILGGGTL
jgi:predicted membrane-bound mannosyltransferase